MDKIKKICDLYDVETPSSLCKRVKYYTMAALDNAPDLREKWGNHSKDPDLQLMEVLIEIDSISSRIHYLEELREQLPKENKGSVFGGLSTNVSEKSYQSFIQFVESQFRELQELRYNGLKNLSKKEKKKFNDEKLQRLVIKEVAESVDYTDLANKSLAKYVEFKNEEPNRSANNIYGDDLEEMFPKLKGSTFLKWEKKYRDKLKALQSAQEN